MNREIKFRCYSKQGGNVLYYFDLNTPTLFYEDDVIMQYTGLQDCNGKDIYEGDIVQSKNKKILFTVVFSQGGFYLQHMNKHQYAFAIYDEETKCEIEYVIGNIYENPELLEASK